MRPAERALLLLCGALDDGLTPLSPHEYRTLRLRMTRRDASAEQRLTEDYLRSLGYPAPAAERIVSLLERQATLDVFLARAAAQGIVPLTRLSPQFPARLRRLEAPAVFFLRGELPEGPFLSLVGSRALLPENRRFAEEIGVLAAREGFTLVSGGANGADRAAQEACLAAGGQVLCIVPDELTRHRPAPRLTYCSEDGCTLAFTNARALHRNHLIHALGERTFVAQCALRTGGTWAGTTDNLRRGLSPVFVFHDGSPAAAELAGMGAELLSKAPSSLAELPAAPLSIFDNFEK